MSEFVLSIVPGVSNRKACFRCKIEKSNSRCKPCTRLWWSGNSAHLRRRYGIDRGEYQRIWDYQEGRCDICKNDLKRGSSTHLDHCHETRRVRGLLCSKCNHGLGLFNDEPALFDRAAAYLRRHGK